MTVPEIRLSVVANPPGLLAEALGRKREFTLPALRRLNVLKAEMPEMLRAFRQSIGVRNVKLSDGEADQAMADLELCAASIADRMIEGSPDFPDIHSFENAFAEIIGPALRLTEGGRVPTVEIVEPEGNEPMTDLEIAGLLPAELLRFAEPGVGGGVNIPRDRRLRRYLGMRAVTVRRHRDALGGDVIGAAQVPVAVLAYDGPKLSGPAAQAAFFSQNKHVFAGKFWPNGQDFPINDLSLSQSLPYQESALAKSLVTEILELTGLANLEPSPYNGGILHLCCHYFTERISSVDQAAPFLSFDDLRKNISVHALRGALASAPKYPHRGHQAASHYARVLVVLNACETAAASPFSDGILQLLFSRGFRHIIASETLVPDGLSSAFATQFYLALMRTENIGEALLSAREALLNTYDNPGGLLYTLYGDPTLKLAIDPARALIMNDEVAQ